MNLCHNQKQCPDELGCHDGLCFDFSLKRHDTKPSFTITVEDCDGPLDLTDAIAEVSMWAKAAFKKAVAADDTYFALADNVGFEQSLVGDIIVVDRVRAPEQMLVTGHDETNKLVRVQRAYNGTEAGAYKRGTAIRIFRVLNAAADTNMVYEDVEQMDGTTVNELIESQLIYEWSANDTCLPGCYWLEFKLLKMAVGMLFSVADSVVPTFASVTSEGCELGDGVESVRRFPVGSDGFLIKITNSPTSEQI